MSKKGKQVFIPGSRDSKFWIMAGKTKSIELTFGYTAQGGGRALGPLATKRKFWGGAVKKPTRDEVLLFVLLVT
ncbi:MAG: RtcB family protein [Candidatus Bathyarchaeota archaeon]|nr:RtcB family protein [Candidatus Bathyarchaeota archaeon]